jgi:hypothetical protein
MGSLQLDLDGSLPILLSEKMLEIFGFFLPFATRSRGIASQGVQIESSVGEAIFYQYTSLARVRQFE